MILGRVSSIRFASESLYDPAAGILANWPSRQLLNLNSSPYLESLDGRQLANLLYRDSLRVKHSASAAYTNDLLAKTNQQKMQHQLALEDMKAAAAAGARAGGIAEVQRNIVAKMLADHMIKAAGPDQKRDKRDEYLDLNLNLNAFILMSTDMMLSAGYSLPDCWVRVRVRVQSPGSQ